MNKRIVLLAAAASAFVLSGQALAEWRAHQDGNNWYIREGNNKIPMPDQKTAEKTAKKNNKAIAKGEKRTEGDGFKPEDSGPCADPASGVRC